MCYCEGLQAKIYYRGKWTLLHYLEKREGMQAFSVLVMDLGLSKAALDSNCPHPLPNSLARGYTWAVISGIISRISP